MIQSFRKVRGEKGFTLIELMVVVIILGILAALSIPLYSGYVRRGKVSEALLAISDIKQGAVAYYQKNSLFTAAADADDVSDKYGVAVDNSKWTYAVTAAGAITATANSVGSGLDTGTITATPTVDARGSISWAITADGTTIKQDEVQ